MARDARTSRVDLYAAIRRDAKAGLSKRALQRKHRVGYRTVAAALDSAWPKERKQPPKRGSRLDPYRGVIDDWLREDLDAPRKQRHTAKRIFDRLLTEHDDRARRRSERGSRQPSSPGRSRCGPSSSTPTPTSTPPPSTPSRSAIG